EEPEGEAESERTHRTRGDFRSDLLHRRSEEREQDASEDEEEGHSRHRLSELVCGRSQARAGRRRLLSQVAGGVTASDVQLSVAMVVDDVAPDDGAVLPLEHPAHDRDVAVDASVGFDLERSTEDGGITDDVRALLDFGRAARDDEVARDRSFYLE